MTHTPGPWIQQFKSSMVYGERYWVFSEVTKEPVAMIHLDRTSQEATEIHKADARLIAAAPEMLEALKDAHGLIYEAIAQMTRKQLDGLSDGFEARREAGEQAIALVEGT